MGELVSHYFVYLITKAEDFKIILVFPVMPAFVAVMSSKYFMGFAQYFLSFRLMIGLFYSLKRGTIKQK